jgi:tetratricopeptide (TPR) repeat protein
MRSDRSPTSVISWCPIGGPVKIQFGSLFAVLTLTAAAQQTNLGHIDFPTSGSKEAQAHFVQGVLLLHSFEYADSKEEFQAATKLEPGFAMAYWGEALTYTHPIWVEQDAAAGRAALQRLAPTPEARAAKAPTQREKDYLHAVELLYGEGDKVARDIAYSDAMDRLRRKYPDDLEAASLFAVALMGTCQHERQYPVYMRAAAVAEEVFAKDPQHPGAIHYLIHAYDDPVHAPLGLRAARVYGTVAGSASHAQHMPAHIFFAMGMWDDAIAANIRSIAVADERIKRKGLGPEARNYHSLLWLEYAYLQEGRNEEAHAVLADVTKSGGRGLAMNRAIYMLETGKPDEALCRGDLLRSPLLQGVAVLNSCGLVAVRGGRLDDARGAMQSIQQRLGGGQGGGGTASPQAAMPMPMSGSGHLPSTESPQDRKTADLMMRQLQAELWIAEGKQEQALRLLAQTAAEEDALTFEFGPPIPVKPSHELYGEELLAAHRPKEAREEFQRALGHAPKRAQSLRGLAKAEAAAGDANASQRSLDDLKSFWHGAMN